MSNMLNRNDPAAQVAIPHGFEQYKQFVNWKLVGDDKIPCSPTGRKIDAHDPENWITAQQALSSRFAPAFVFTQNDPFAFIDLDHAFRDGAWSTTATAITAMFPGAAVEVSHSRTGLHIFVSGSASIPADHRCKNASAGVELYTHGRFVALTGLSAAGSALVDGSAALGRLVAAYGLEPAPSAVIVPIGGDAPDAGYTGPADDGELLAVMQAAKGSIAAVMRDAPRVWDLWTAAPDVLAKKYPPIAPRADGCPFDRSAADAALMSHLAFWTGKQRSRMIRLFSQSALWRPDHYAGGKIYRLNNILDIAISRCTKVYDKPRATANASAVVTTGPGGYLQIEAQKQFFAGCVYIADRHQIATPHYGLMDWQRFRAIYGGYEFQMQADGGRPTKNAFEAFTENRMHQFPKVRRTMFRPDVEAGSIVGDTLNIWRAPVIDEHTGDVAWFLGHLARLLPDPRDRKILLTYMQSLVRNPGIKFQWAPVIQGVEGNGKTFLIKCVAYAVGEEFSYSPKASQLTEKFNSWLEHKLFIGVEEIKIPDHRREMMEDLKDWITNDRVEIRHVGGTKTMSQNFANWMLTTNHQDAVPITKNQRRYSMLFTAQQDVDDLTRDGMTSDYFRGLYDWFNHHGGKQAVSWFLRHSSIDPEFDPAAGCVRAPVTAATPIAINASLGRVEQEILEAVEERRIGFLNGWVSTAAIAALITEKHLSNISPGRMRTILLSLGYKHVLKSSRILPDGTRPNLWRRGLGGTLEEFIRDQNPCPNVLTMS